METRIDRGMTIGEIAAVLQEAPRVFERWNLDYFCHGSTSLAEACEAAGIDAEEVFVDLLEARRMTIVGTREEWQDRPLDEIAAHRIREFHETACGESDQLVSLAVDVRQIHGRSHPELEQLEQRASFCIRVEEASLRRQRP